MTAAQWQAIIRQYEQGDQRPFNQFYNRLLPEYASIFRARYSSLAHISFEEIFNDKVLKILQRTLNHTLEVKAPKKIIFRAIDYHYLDLLRHRDTTKYKERKTEPLDDKVVKLGYTDSMKSKEEHLAEQQAKDQRLQQLHSLDFLDDFGSRLIEGVLAQKKDKDIKEEMGYTGTASAFSQRKKNIFNKIRRHLYQQQ